MINKRQKALIDLLMSKPGQFTSKEQIASALKELYPRHLENTTTANSQAFRELRRDIDNINRDPDFEMIIVSSAKGYKLGTQNECLKYYDSRIKEHLKALKCDWAILRKMQNNGQIKGIDEYIKVIETFEGGDNGRA